MILVINYSDNKFLGTLVKRSLENSFGKIVLIKKKISIKDINKDTRLILFINSKNKKINKIFNYASNNKIKIIFYGNISNEIIPSLNIKKLKKNKNFKLNLDETNFPIKSNLLIQYKKNILNKNSFKRYFEIYHFEKEWNNYGYGKIDQSNKLLKINSFLKIKKKNQISYVTNKNKIFFCSYAGLWRDKNCVLWFNRLSGPFDSYEWRILENFVSNLQHKKFKCLPCLSDIPYNFKGLATARIDCDEKISSSNYVVNFYKKKKIPLSLAIVTNLLDTKENINFLRNNVEKDLILSHSKTHRNNWGGNYTNAVWETTESRNDIYRNFKIVNNYSVSPFHQTPKYAIKAMEFSGYQGFVGGIIKNDPYVLLARAGKTPYSDKIITMSNQCMLHGDIMKKKKSINTFYETIRSFKRSKMIFGYLDHPFSERYKYGWDGEKDRIQCHSRIIKFLRKEKFKFLGLNQILRFINDKSNIVIKKNKNYFTVLKTTINTPYFHCLEYKGKKYKLDKELKINE